jgi:transposase
MEIVKVMPLAASPEDRAKALAMVAQGASFREAATAVGVSFIKISTWVQEADADRAAVVADSPRAPKRRAPVYVDGKRLGRIALWT